MYISVFFILVAYSGIQNRKNVSHSFTPVNKLSLTDLTGDFQGDADSNLRFQYDGLPEEGIDDRPPTLDRDSNVTVERLELIFHKYKLIKTLESKHIGLEERATIATRYLNDISEVSPIVPDLSRGGLYKDWNATVFDD